MSDPTVQSTVPLLAIDQPYGEGHPNLEFIKRSLPAWYRRAPKELRQALRESQLYSQLSQQALEPVRKRLMSVQDFAEPRLVDALDRRFNLSLDVQRNEFVTFRIENSHVTGSHTIVRKQSLLQAALQNFDDSETRTGRFLLGAALLPVNGLQRVQVEEDRFPDFPDAALTRWRYVYNGLIDIKPEDFTRLCRNLDLGGQYQTHLDSVFKPAPVAGQTAAAAAQDIADTFMRSERDAFSVLTHIALMKQHISPPAHEMLVEWLKPGSQPLWNGASVRHCQLQMLTSPSLPREGLMGFMLNTPALPANALFRELVDSTAFPGSVLFGALLIETATEEGPCLVYMPAEPEHPLKEYPSFTAFTHALRRKLASKRYQQYFQRFVDLRISHFFFKKIDDRLGLTAHSTGDTFNEDADLQLEKVAVATPPFHLLYGHLVSKIYRDSRVVAVPTDDEDQASRLARLLSYETQGLDLLNVAAFFIPVLGEVMAVVAISQLLQETFIGFDEWRHGETDEALTHVFNIVENVALTAVLATAAGAVTPEAPAPSAFVEGMTPVTLGDGRTRLWKPELGPFQQALRLPAGKVADSEGRIEHGGKTWLPVGERFYQIELDPALQKWRIKHPTQADGYSPVLERTRAGRWRLDAENAMAWDSGSLFRRLHVSLERFSDVTVERIMAVTGIDDAVLRQVHVEGQALPALLRDSIQRFQTEVIIEPPSQDPLVRLVQRDFPSLPAGVATEIVQSANGLEKARMTTAHRLPLRLAEQAREYQQALRLNRANAGFYQPVANNPDTATAGLQMLEQLPGWPHTVALEVREDTVAGQRLSGIGDSQQAASRQVLVKSASGYQAFDSAGVALGQPDQEFFSALLQALPPTTRTAIGLSTGAIEAELRALLGDVAVKQRDRVAQSLGMQPIKPGFKSPSRLDDGRVGYPLSGRMRALFARLGFRGSSFSPEMAVKGLFPVFSDAEVRGFLQQIRAEYTQGSGGIKAYVQQRLLALGEEYKLLERTLDHWVAEGDGLRMTGPHFLVVTAADKRIAARRIKNCWRRQSSRRYLDTGQFIGYELDLSGLAMGQLPAMTARFDHVGSLVVEEVDMTSSEAQTLLGQFNNLYWLSLRGNQLTTIPEALAAQTRLIRLSLRNNPLTLDEVSAQRLQRLDQLHRLSLSRCPIGPLLDLRSFSQLRRLSLRATGIDRVPTGLVECELLDQADLRDNRITQLPYAFVQRMNRGLRRFQVHDNPIDAASQALSLQVLGDRAWTLLGAGEARAHAGNVANPGVLWMAGLANHQLVSRLLLWSDLQAEPHAEDFFRVLNDLTLSADYHNNRWVLAQRVRAVVDATSQYSVLRDELFAMAEHPDTCGDGAAIIFNDMEIRVLLFKVMDGLQRGDLGAQRDALFRLARALDRLDEIEKIALGDIAGMQQVNEQPDQAEVRLAYRLGLAQRLELPEQPQGMLFNQLSGVSNRMLDIAERRVLERERSPEFLQSMIDREFWMTFLEQHYAQRFEQVKAPFYEHLERLDAERENISDESYLRQIQAIEQGRASAVNALALELTQTINQALMPLGSTMFEINV